MFVARNYTQGHYSPVVPLHENTPPASSRAYSSDYFIPDELETSFSDSQKTENYIDHPGKVSNFLSLNDSPILIEVLNQEKLGEGNNAVVYSQTGLKYVSPESGHEEVKYAAKIDRREGCTKKEASNLSKLWKELSEEEKKHVLPFVAILETKIAPDGPIVNTTLYTNKLGENLSNASKFHSELKNKTGDDLIESFETIVKRGRVLLDIKLRNAVLGQEANQAAVFIDYEELTDLEDLKSNPSKIASFINDLSGWDPTELLFDELLILRYTKITSENLDEIFKLVRLMGIFAVGSMIYGMFTELFPYPTINLRKSKVCPKSIKQYSSQVQRLEGYPETHIRHLKESGCRADLAAKIVKMIHPFAEERFIPSGLGQNLSLEELEHRI